MLPVKPYEPHILLSQLKSLLSRKPDFDFDKFSLNSTEYQSWLGQAYALVNRWNPAEATNLSSAVNFLGTAPFHAHSLAQILGAVHRAIADLELQLPSNTGQVFGPGAAYDFFKALSQVLASAQKSLFIADLYMDSSIFDTYLSSVANGVAVRLLLHQYAANVKSAAEKFIAQHKISIEVKTSKAFHDRVIFVDDDTCWVLGQSIKDAAGQKPTYLAPLSPDVVALKLTDYESIWRNASKV